MSVQNKRNGGENRTGISNSAAQVRWRRLDTAVVVLQITKEIDRRDETDDFHEEEEQRHSAQRFRMSEEDAQRRVVTSCLERFSLLAIVVETTRRRWTDRGGVVPVRAALHAAARALLLQTVPLDAHGLVRLVFGHGFQQVRAELVLRLVAKGKCDNRSDQLQKKNDHQRADEHFEQTQTIAVRAEKA